MLPAYVFMEKKSVIWDDRKFVKRCEDTAKKKGWTLYKLCQEANIAENYLKSVPAHGRNIASIMRLAAVLDVTVEWLISPSIPKSLRSANGSPHAKGSSKRKPAAPKKRDN